MKRLLLTILFVMLAGMAFVVVYLLEAHWEVRSVAPALPTQAALFKAAGSDAGPVRIHYINTASQESAGRKVIHPAYVLEWADGRLFLIEVGMDREGAQAFGDVMESYLGADPIRFFGAAAQQLGARVHNVTGLAVSHLHVDHTGGITQLCETVSHQITVYQTEIQATQGNYVTAPGQAHLNEADCASRVVLQSTDIFSFVDFPGLVAVSAGGHTPGSTIFFANVGGTLWVLAGDIAWTVEDIWSNTPKPAAYSTFVVPEYGARMEELRHWLKALDADPNIKVLVSHGEAAMLASGMPAWAPEPPVQ